MKRDSESYTNYYLNKNPYCWKSRNHEDADFIYKLVRLTDSKIFDQVTIAIDLFTVKAA